MDREQLKSKKEDFLDQAIKKESRKLKARRKNGISPWWGFRLFGLVGWSVIISALIGVFIAGVIEHYYTGRHTWAAMFLLGGILIGFIIALILLAKEMFKNGDN